MWGATYVDELVLRDRDADANSGNGLEERLYALQEAQYSVTALVDTSGAVQERFAYTPYGLSSVYNADLTSKGGGTSYDWEHRYTGRRLGSATGLQLNRNRYYHQQLGRWCGRDPIGYEAGFALYQYVLSSPLRFLDPSGLRIVRCCQINHDGDYGPEKYVWVPDTFVGGPCGVFAGGIGDRVGECKRPPDVTIAVRMCGGDPNCEKELVQLLNLIPKVWVWGFFTGNPFCKNDGFIACGSRETCKWWQIDFMTMKLETIGAFNCISAQPHDFNYHGNWPGWQYHATIEVCFPSGKCIIWIKVGLAERITFSRNVICLQPSGRR